MNNSDNNALTIGFFGVLSLMLFGLVLFFLKIQDSNENQQPIIIQQAPHVKIPPCNPPIDYIGEARILYSMGYEDGCIGQLPNYNYKNNIHYVKGYRDGSRHCPNGIQFQIGIDFRN